MRMLDLFCGRGGWTNAFLARAWDCVGIDLNPQPEYRGEFVQVDALTMVPAILYGFDFICASSPCEQFSVHGMKHFHPNPPYPELGVRLFNHTRAICEASGVPYVMENVRAAQQFVGNAVHHCGPFYLWGSAVPPLIPKGIIKGWETKHHFVNGKWCGGGPGRGSWSTSQGRKEGQAKVATIPPELANCVADYAERLLEQRRAIA